MYLMGKNQLDDIVNNVVRQLKEIGVKVEPEQYNFLNENLSGYLKSQFDVEIRNNVERESLSPDQLANLEDQMMKTIG